MTTVKVATRIGVVTFKQINDKRFAVRCPQHPPIKLKQNKAGTWEGNGKTRIFNSHGVETVAVGKTARACYKNAVKSFWL